MALYKYLALNENSKKIKASSEADSSLQLTDILKAEGLFLLWCKEQPAKEIKKYKLKANELTEFSKEISAMLHAGVTVIRALEIMLNRDIKPVIKATYERLVQGLQQGNQLSTALAEQNGAFPELMINMFRAGEESGQLDKTAAKMADYYDKEYKLQNKIKAAMTYPIILLVILVGVMLIIFTVVLPTFFTLFKDMELPFVTKVVMAISSGLINYWFYLLLTLFILIALIDYLVKRPAVSIAIDRAKLKLTSVGKLLKIIYTARFARTLSSLYASGISIIDAITIAMNIIGNKYIQAQFHDVRWRLLNGESLSNSLAPVEGLDSKLISTVLIGEETGKLEDMLNSVADNFEYEAELATARLVALLEPAFIVIMAVVVGFVMLSVMLPIMTLYNNIG